MPTSQSAKNSFVTDQDFLSELDHTIEEATKGLIRTFEKSAVEVKGAIVHEFSRAPWLYFTACLGSGILIGYMASSKSRRAECRT